MVQIKPDWLSDNIKEKPKNTWGNLWQWTEQLKSNVASKVAWIQNDTKITLGLKPKSRHSIQNETTEYLDYLEETFKKEAFRWCESSEMEEALKKLEAITVTEEWYINIAGFQHKLWTVSLSWWDDDWIYNHAWNTLLDQNALSEYVKSQEEYIPYSMEEMKKLFDSIPSIPNSKHHHIVEKLLKLPRAGQETRYTIKNDGWSVSLWTSTYVWEIPDNPWRHKIAPWITKLYNYAILASNIEFTACDCRVLMSLIVRKK